MARAVWRLQSGGPSIPGGWGGGDASMRLDVRFCAVDFLLITFEILFVGFQWDGRISTSEFQLAIVIMLE